MISLTQPTFILEIATGTAHCKVNEIVYIEHKVLLRKNRSILRAEIQCYCLCRCQLFRHVASPRQILMLLKWKNSLQRVILFMIIKGEYKSLLFYSLYVKR